MSKEQNLELGFGREVSGEVEAPGSAPRDHHVPSLNVTSPIWPHLLRMLTRGPPTVYQISSLWPGPCPGSSISKRDLAGSIGGAGQGLMLF